MQSRERLCVALDGALELAGHGIVEVARLGDGFENIGMLVAQRAEQAVLEGAYAVDRQWIEIAVDSGIDDADLLLHAQRRELRLLEQFGEPRAAVEQALGGGVEIGAELRERRHLAVLRQLALDAAGDLLHRLG